MSRQYKINLIVERFDKSKTKAIIKAAKNEWPFEKPFAVRDEPYLAYSAEDSLGGGESEEEFSARLARAVFEANGKPCKVLIEAMCLEYVPFSEYIFDEENPPGEDFTEARA